ncbi:hypothetical protein BGZ99_003900, partial [Dissophora globulifera]
SRSLPHCLPLPYLRRPLAHLLAHPLVHPPAPLLRQGRHLRPGPLYPTRRNRKDTSLHRSKRSISPGSFRIRRPGDCWMVRARRTPTTGL